MESILAQTPVLGEDSKIRKLTSGDDVATLIYRTKNFGKFKFIKGNRHIDETHVKRIRTSMRDEGILFSPITVNEKGEIIDGQHRFLALQGLDDAEICYQIVPGYALDEVQILNQNHSNWKLKDQVISWADKGNVHYIQLHRFILANPCFSIGDCIIMCSGTRSDTPFRTRNLKSEEEGFIKVDSKGFKKGLWQVGNMDQAYEYASMIRSLEPYYDGYSRSVFVRSLLGLFEHPSFDFGTFVNKVRMRGYTMHNPSTIKDCRAMIEDVYNYKRRKKVNLRY